MKFVVSNIVYDLTSALRNGINRRNADVLDKAIQEAKQSAHMDKLANYITEGEKMLKDADKNPKYILEMKRTTISEIHRYKIPKQVMFDVMKAVYVLLGQDLDTLKVSVQVLNKIIILMTVIHCVTIVHVI